MPLKRIALLFSGLMVTHGLWVSRADAAFHLMQIEQVIAGVNGDLTAQAIQLRMRSAGQNQVQSARIRAWDAAGANPVILINMNSAVASGASGARVLITTASFNSQTTPAATANFTMTPIPASYLAAGSLTFESDGGLVYWRLSWGGAGYTGTTTGLIDNDPDGNFGPAYPDPLPSTCARAVRFQGTATAASSNNAADYALTAGAAVFNNNAGSAFTVNTVADACCTDSECPGRSCVDGTCSAGEVPAASEWALMIMAALVLAAGAAVLMRRRQVA